jgi:hypothetical protein
MLERARIASFHHAEVHFFAFSDDHNIIVISQSFEVNCGVLERLHEYVMRWATEKGVSFGPEKYGIMHLEPTGEY